MLKVTNLIEDRPTIDHGSPFETMAARIRKNADEGFAGAFVVVAPDGESIENLFLNNTGDPVIFWSNLKTIAEMTINDLENKAKAGQHFRF